MCCDWLEAYCEFVRLRAHACVKGVYTHKRNRKLKMKLSEVFFETDKL